MIRRRVKRFLPLVRSVAGAALFATAFAAESHVPADRPVARTDRNSQLAHQQLLEKARQGRIDLYFLGDSITRRWGGTDYPQFLAHWNQTFHGWSAANFGWGGDTTQNILWRLQNGELDGVNPKVIVLLAGTNNVGREPGNEAKASDIANGIRAIVDLCRRFLNSNDRLADREGVLFPGLTVDQLHLSVKGYQIWADALKPILTELLGPPAARDYAPPPTGDPSAAAKPAATR